MKRLAMFKAIFFCCFAASFISGSWACNGCHLKKAELKPCPGTENTNIVRVGMETMELDDNCILKLKGWVNVTKTVKKLQVNWQFKKDVLEGEGDGDGCEKLANLDEDHIVGPFIKLFNFPKKCPIEEGTRNIDKEIDLSQFKDSIGMAEGLSSAKVEIAHDAGASCFTFNANVHC